MYARSANSFLTWEHFRSKGCWICPEHSKRLWTAPNLITMIRNRIAAATNTPNVRAMVLLVLDAGETVQ